MNGYRKRRLPEEALDDKIFKEAVNSIVTVIQNWVFNSERIRKHWQTQVKILLETVRDYESQQNPKGDHPWPWPLPGPFKESIERSKDMPALYAFFAFLHDYCQPGALIITPEIEAIRPELCEWPTTTARYMCTKWGEKKDKDVAFTHYMGPNTLNTFFGQIRRDIENSDLLQDGSDNRDEIAVVDLTKWSQDENYQRVLDVCRNTNGVEVKNRRQYNTIKERLKRKSKDPNDGCCKLAEDLVYDEQKKIIYVSNPRKFALQLPGN